MAVEKEGLLTFIQTELVRFPADFPALKICWVCHSVISVATPWTVASGFSLNPWNFLSNSNKGVLVMLMTDLWTTPKERWAFLVAQNLPAVLET